MIWRILVLVLLLNIGNCATPGEEHDICTPTQLSSRVVEVPAKRSSYLDLYVNYGIPYDLRNAFTDVFLNTELVGEGDFNVYHGHNCSSVLSDYKEDNKLFGLFKSVSLWKANHLQPFNTTIIGIDTLLKYKVRTTTVEFNYFRVGLFVGGILLYLFAPTLARNVLFYYASGCSIGMLASILLVAFIVYRFAPKKAIGYPIILGGWTVSLYMLRFAWSNLSDILLKYQKGVIAYFAVALLISFAVCYKRGPPTDARSLDIIQWMLQLLAIAAIYFSSQVSELSYAVIVVLLSRKIVQIVFGSVFYVIGTVLRGIWRWFFPSRPRFLTEEEYQKQMHDTTLRELSKLKEYCRSPGANAWKITKSVKDPNKLARFVDGTEDHVSDDEIAAHDVDSDFLPRSFYDEDISDDDDDVEHEVIIRSTSRSRNSSRNKPMSFVARGLTAQELANRLTSSAAIPSRARTRLVTRQEKSGRHSFGGVASLPSRHQTASSNHNGGIGSEPRGKLASTRMTIRSNSGTPKLRPETRPRNRAINKNVDRKDFYSSDSEDGGLTEEDLIPDASHHMNID